MIEDFKNCSTQTSYYHFQRSDGQTQTYNLDKI
jgi:hypothetical protein